MAVLCYLVWFYPVGLYRNAEYTDTVHSRSTLTLLVIWASFLFASSFAHMLIAGIETADGASALCNVMFIMMYAFCGILAGPDALPGFWIFMYRVNPLTYLVSSLLSAGLGDARMYCADNELLTFSAPDGMACGDYMQDYQAANGGYLLNPNAQGSEQCNYCALEYTNDYLSGFSINFDNRWRDFGLLWVYIVVNTVGAIVFYKLFRVPRTKKAQKA
jgi:ABC-type multidrug transport system permease subunit